MVTRIHMPVLSSLNDIKQGTTILYNGEPHVVVKSQFVRMQQRKPVMQTKMRNLITNKIVEYSFKSGDRVEEAEIQKRKVNFLYHAGKEFAFMDNADYEQIILTENQVEGKQKFLKEGLEVSIVFFNSQPINLELPPKVDFTVVSTIEGVKGDTAQGRVMKDAELENGSKILVPMFIKQGEIVRINTDTGDYVERVNS